MVDLGLETSVDVEMVGSAGVLHRSKALISKAIADASVRSSIGMAIASQFILVLSGVSTARLLGPTDRGYFAILMLWPTILFQIAAVGLPIAVAYFVARSPHRGRPLLRQLRSVIALQILILVSVHLAILLWYLVGKPAAIKTGGMLLLAVGPCALVQSYYAAMVQGWGAYRRVYVIRLLPQSLLTAATLALLVIQIRNFIVISTAASAAWLVTTIAARIIASPALDSAESGLTTESPSTGSVIKYGAQLAIGSLYPIDGFRVDQLLIGVLMSPINLGFYVVAQGFTNFPRFLAQALGVVVLPRVASLPTQRDRFLRTWRYLVFAAPLLLGSSLAIFVAAPWLVLILYGSEFEPGALLLRILIVGMAFLSLRRLLSDASTGCGLPRLGSVAEIGSWFVFVAALPVGLTNGAAGVAVSVAMSYLGGLVLLVALLFLADMRSRGVALHRALQLLLGPSTLDGESKDATLALAESPSNG